MRARAQPDQRGVQRAQRPRARDGRGEIHGQFHDMMEMFKLGGPAPTPTTCFSAITSTAGITALRPSPSSLPPKVRYPDRVTIIRGNHES